MFNGIPVIFTTVFQESNYCEFGSSTLQAGNMVVVTPHETNKCVILFLDSMMVEEIEIIGFSTIWHVVI